MSDVTSTHRSVIAAELQRLHDENAAKQHQEAARREAQRDRTRSLVRLMQLDTRDEGKIALHAENAALYNQRAAILEQIRLLQDRYQAEKKRLPSIPDKKERHERLQRAKAARDRDVTGLRYHFAQLEASAPPVVRPGSSSYSENVSRAATPAGIVSLPEVAVQEPSRRSERVSATEYKQLMDQIRAVKLERQTMLDPYVANAWVVVLGDNGLLGTIIMLWRWPLAARSSLGSPPRHCAMSGELRRRLPDDEGEGSCTNTSRNAGGSSREATVTDLLSKFIELARPEDRLKDVAYVDRILREQEYIEDPTLASTDEITFAIRSTNSLGYLTDLRFKLLKDLLATSPTDLYLIESVANIHVRRGEFAAAEELTSRFVVLPSVKRMSLYGTLAELRYGM